MFQFGSPQDIARVHFDSVAADFDYAENNPEATLDEWKVQLTYRRMAFKQARSSGANEETMAIMLDKFDEAFYWICVKSDLMMQLIRVNKFKPLLKRPLETERYITIFHRALQDSGRTSPLAPSE